MIPYKCSWSIKKLLNNRGVALQHLSFCVASNCNWLLWHDPWLIAKPLLQHLGNHIVSTVGSSNLAQSVLLSPTDLGIWGILTMYWLLSSAICSLDVVYLPLTMFVEMVSVMSILLRFGTLSDVLLRHIAGYLLFGTPCRLETALYTFGLLFEIVYSRKIEWGNSVWMLTLSVFYADVILKCRTSIFYMSIFLSASALLPYWHHKFLAEVVEWGFFHYSSA